MDKKRRIICVEIDDEVEEKMLERMEYLKSKNPFTKITVSDAVRHALLNTSYRREKKGRDED